MTAITALNVRLGMDASNFSQGADLARSEVNKVAAVMRQSAPPAEKFKRDVDLLNKTFSESGRQTKEYAQALEFLRKKYGQIDPPAKKTTSAIDELKQSMMGAVPGGQMLGNILKGPAGALIALGAAATVAIRGMSEAAQRIDQTAKAAKTAGVAFADLVAIQMLAAESTGVDVAVVNKGVRELSKRLAEARVNGGALSDVLKASGSSVAELASMAPADAFKAVADIIANIPDKAEQIRIATLAIGEEGAQLVEMFRLGGTAIDAMKQEAERLGAVLSDGQVAEIEAMNDAFGRVRMAIDGIWNAAISALAPALKELAKLASDFFVMIRKSGVESEKIAPIFTVIGAVVSKVSDILRAILAVMSDTMSIIGSLPGWITGGELNTSFSESNRLLDEMDARANGVAASTQQATDAAEALAIETERAAEAARQQEATYEKRLQDLQIESVALAGNTDLAERMRLAAEGYSQTQIDTIQAMQQQNNLIKERIAAEAEAAKEEEKNNAEITKRFWSDVKKTEDKLKELDKDFTIEVGSAMKAAQQFFEQERQRDDQRREAVSAGPGAGMQEGSAEAAKFMADQTNARIGLASVPVAPTPGEKEIADKTEELLVAQRAANTKQEEELKVMQDLLVQFKENGFKRAR